MEGNITTLKPLPRQKQDFESTIKQGLLYVDKTDYIYKISHDVERRFVFLGRPRRFGKSLFMSALQCYFEGRRDLFEGMRIMEMEKEWKKYEVLKFDFSCATEEELKSQIDDTLAKYEAKYGISQSETKGRRSRLNKIIDVASKGENNRLVILVDEYDSPLGSSASNKEEHESIAKVYRDFFPTIKECEAKIKFFMITGVMKYTKMSIFSTFNNICNISSRVEYASVCGFTHEELRGVLMPYVERMAEAQGVGTKEMVERLIERYDSYCFSKDTTQKVFNPYGLINCLADKELGSYWNESGKTKILFDTIERVEYEIPDWDNLCLGNRVLENGDYSPSDLVLAMYQCGYLTIKRYDDGIYDLRIPNKEVAEAITDSIIPLLCEKNEGAVVTRIEIMKRYLKNDNIDAFMKEIKALVAATPYDNEKGAKMREDRFQCALFYIFMACGYDARREVEMCDGRIDVLAMNKRNIFIVETKLGANGGLEEAVRQINERKYFEPYMTDERNVYCAAIEFDEARRMVEKWRVWDGKTGRVVSERG